jgi:NADP-dependent 3-hydroxy acid dehydrogenase YdfG
MAGKLSNRVAVVTGASAGIGYATAISLAREGAAVVVQARRSEKLESLAKEVRDLGGKVLAVKGDASKEKDIDDLLARAKEFAEKEKLRLDMFIVNAGRGLAGGLLGSDMKQWREMYELNVMGAAYLMRRAGEHLVPLETGDIVALGSASGKNVSPFSGFYGSSKFAIAGMTEAFRREICSKGVRVTLLLPGIVETEFQGVAGYTPENFYKGIARFGKLLTAEDIAETILFVVTRPKGVHVNEVVIRPTGQDYP